MSFVRACSPIRHLTGFASNSLIRSTTILRSQSYLRTSSTSSSLIPLLSTRTTMSSSALPSSVPRTMKGVLCNATGGVDVLEYKTDLPVPVPKEGEVLVKNDYIGINYIDTYFRTGLYPSPKPEILGREAEGTIVAVGPSSSSANLFGLKTGDRVVWMGTGGYAEYTSVLAKAAYAIPSGIAPKLAVAAYLQGLTALTLIREAHHVEKGQWVLVHAAAGGVGLMLCQLLRAIGAHTIGTASTPEKCEQAKKNGAEFVINYTEEKDLEGKILELTGGEGCHAIFDGVGKSTFELDLQVVRRKGTLVSFGNASGAVPPVTLQKLSAKNIKLLRPVLFNYLTTRSELEHYSSELFNFILNGALEVNIHEVYPLEDVRKAQTDLEGRKTTGKLLMKP